MPVGADADGSKLNLGRGKVYFDRFDANGISTGERLLGQCKSFSGLITPQTVDAYDSTTKGSGLLARAVIRSTGEVSIEMQEYSAENLALAMFGDTASLAQSSVTPVVAAPIANLGGGCVLNRWYNAAVYNIGLIGNFTAKKGAATLVGHIPGSFAANDDYVIDLVNGRIMFMAGTGGIVAGDTTLTIGYTPVSKTYLTVRGGTVPLINGKLVFIGDNINGQNHHVEVWKVQLGGDGEFPFIADDFAAPKLKGAVLSDAVNHPNEPYWRVREIS